MNTISRSHVGLSVLVICAWVSVLAGTFYLVAKPVREPSIDFYSYYIGASALHREEPMYAAETHESVAAAVGIKNADRYVYPPTLAALIQPFLLTSPYVASLVWFGVNVALLLIGVGLLYRHINFKDRQVSAALLLLPMLFTPTLMTLYLGQANILMFVLITLSYLAFVRGRPYISGALLALSAWIKVWPIVLVAYFVWKREWKVVLGAIVGLVGVGLLTLVLAGSQQTASFFTDQLPELIREGTHGQLDHLNQSIPGTFAKMFAPSSDYVRPFIENPALARQGSRIASLILVAATVILSSRPIALRNRKQLSTEFMLVIIATMLITQRLWESNLVLLLPAYFFIAEQLENEHNMTRRQIALLIVSIVLINMHRVIWTLAAPVKQALPWFMLAFPFLGVMLVWLIFATKRLREIRALSTVR